MPRMHTLTVAQVIHVLSKAPPEAEILFKDNGYLQASHYEAWGEFEVIERPNREKIIKTKWQ